jgi:hypothetical protein
VVRERALGQDAELAVGALDFVGENTNAAGVLFLEACVGLALLRVMDSRPRSKSMWR